MGGTWPRGIYSSTRRRSARRLVGMSESTATIRYEPPAIVRRDLVAGLLDSTPKSDAANDNGAHSDANVKENIRPVRW
jgi:hypothetical protein